MSLRLTPPQTASCIDIRTCHIDMLSIGIVAALHSHTHTPRRCLPPRLCCRAGVVLSWHCCPHHTGVVVVCGIVHHVVCGLVHASSPSLSCWCCLLRWHCCPCCAGIIALIALRGHPCCRYPCLVALALPSSAALSTTLSTAEYKRCCNCPAGFINCAGVIALIALAFLLPASCFYHCHCHDVTIAVIALAALLLLYRHLHRR